MFDSLLILLIFFQVGGENDYACHAGSGLTNVVQHQMDMNTNPGGYGGGAASYYASPGSSYHGGGPGTPGTTPGPHTTYPGRKKIINFESTTNLHI